MGRAERNCLNREQGIFEYRCDYQEDTAVHEPFARVSEPVPVFVLIANRAGARKTKRGQHRSNAERRVRNSSSIIFIVL